MRAKVHTLEEVRDMLAEAGQAWRLEDLKAAIDAQNAGAFLVEAKREDGSQIFAHVVATGGRFPEGARYG